MYRMTEKLSAVEALRAAEAAGETPSWEAVYQAIHSVEGHVEAVRDGCDALHGLATAALEPCSYDPERYKLALLTVTNRLDQDVKACARQYAAACNLAFLRHRAMSGEA